MLGELLVVIAMIAGADTENVDHDTRSTLTVGGVELVAETMKVHATGKPSILRPDRNWRAELIGNVSVSADNDLVGNAQKVMVRCDDSQFDFNMIGNPRLKTREILARAKQIQFSSSTTTLKLSDDAVVFFTTKDGPTFIGAEELEYNFETRQLTTPGGKQVQLDGLVFPAVKREAD